METILPSAYFSLILPYAVAIAITIIAIYSIFYGSCGDLLPPGPFSLPIVGNLPFLRPNLHTYFTHLSSIHGPIFLLRLGSKPSIVISSPNLAREILRDHDRIFANRDVPASARVIAYGGSDIVWNPNGPTWRMLRKICVRQMLSPTSLDAVYLLRRREIRSTVRRLHSSAVSGVAVEIGVETFLTVLNIITSMLWGGTVKGEEDDLDTRTVGKEFRDLVGEITELLGRPNVSDFFPSMARFDLQGIEKKMRGFLERFDGIFARIIETKRDGSTEKKDFLDFMLSLEKKGFESGAAFTITHVKALLMDMVVGGTDTSSNTLEFAMAELIHRPDAIRRAQDELDRVVGKDAVVEESHLSQLHYLNAVVKEVLRLHPPLPLLVPHCPSAQAVIGGYTVPEGSRVFINVWAIHRDPAIWANPSDFKPERFAGMEGSRWDNTASEFSYFPFGSGRRACAGIPMAERMMMHSLASMLHSFDWRLPEGVELDFSEKFGIVLKKADPLIAIPIPRLSNPKLYT